MILRFEMSGQRFDFDEAPELFTFDELFIVEDVFGLTLDGFLASAKLIGRPGGASAGLRAMGIVAFLAYRRGGGDLDWAAFAKTVAPATLRLIPDEPAPEPEAAPVVSPTAAVLDAGPNIFDVPNPTS